MKKTASGAEKDNECNDNNSCKIQVETGKQKSMKVHIFQTKLINFFRACYKISSVFIIQISRNKVGGRKKCNKNQGCFESGM